MVLETIGNPQISIDRLAVDIKNNPLPEEKYFNQEIWDRLLLESKKFPEDLITIASKVAVVWPDRLGMLGLTSEASANCLDAIPSPSTDPIKYAQNAANFILTFPEHSYKLGLDVKQRGNVFNIGAKTPYEILKSRLDRIKWENLYRDAFDESFSLLVNLIILAPERKNELRAGLWEKLEQSDVLGAVRRAGLVHMATDLARMRVVFPESFGQVDLTDSEIHEIEEHLGELLTTFKNGPESSSGPGQLIPKDESVLYYLEKAVDLAILTADQVVVDNKGIHLVSPETEKSVEGIEPTPPQPEERNF